MRPRLLRTDLLGLVPIGLAAALFFSTYFRIRTDDYHREDTVDCFAVSCAVLGGTGLLIALVGRWRDRQERKRRDEETRRGFASRKPMPVGDQVATAIARGTLTLIVSYIAVCLILPIFVLYDAAPLRIGPYGTRAVLRTGVLGIAILTAVATWWWLWSHNRRRQEPTCPGCGYVLFGAADRRCPECSRSFDLAEIDTQNARLDEHGILQPKDGVTGK